MSRSNPKSISVQRPFRLLRKFGRVTARILLTGFVVIMPFVLLGFLLGMALDFVRGVLQPVITVLRWAGIIRMANFGIIGQVLIEIGIYNDMVDFFVEFIAILVLLGTVVVLGVFASFHWGKRTMEYLDTGIAAIPGVGPIYRSFRRLGDVVLERGLEEFRSVKVVEFPHDGCFSLAFETNRAPESVSTVIEDEDLVTLFVPLAPNPVMGGFLIHIPRDRVYEIEMTVEEAARALFTSGVAAGEQDFEEDHSLSLLHRADEFTNRAESEKRHV